MRAYFAANATNGLVSPDLVRFSQLERAGSIGGTSHFRSTKVPVGQGKLAGRSAAEWGVY